MTQPAKHLTKPQLLDLAAKAMNLLMALRCDTEDGCFPLREENDFHELAQMLPERTREHFWNNATLDSRDL